MAKRNDRFFPELKPEGLARQAAVVREKLRSAKTLEVHPNELGIYAASSSQPEQAATGYQNAWLRDNAMVAFSKWACGDPQSAMSTARGLTTFLKTQTEKMERIIAKPKRKEEVNERPHIRFNAKELKENEESWSHAQNDALGETVWLRFLLANESGFVLEAEEREFYAVLLRYFEAIQYWKDADSGAWEETRKINSSSIGAVMAGLREMDRYLRDGHELEGVKKSGLADLLKRGRRVLEVQLPFEAPPERRTDAALLFLIYPLGIVTDDRIRRLIVSLARVRLTGEVGIRRYPGDSYFCQDYDQWFRPEERRSDFAKLAVRDEFLQPSCEAQWCLFDPLLSVIHATQYQQNGAPEALDLQLAHLNRAIAQLDEYGRCPELYFLKRGKWTPNEHTPLAWTQANLSTALDYLDRSVRKQPADQANSEENQ
jgi:phosphorylase kinase alpha/beta subunit